MRASWKVARVFGIELRLHAAFLLVPAWAFFQGWREGGSAAATGSVLLVLGVFACVALHELGHSLVARAYGIDVRRITLLPFGGAAELSRIPERPREEMVIALAGPLVNLGLAGLLLLARGGMPRLEDLAVLPHDARSLTAMLLFANLVLAVFNLLPAFPMDGGRILRSLLATVLPRARATHAASALGQVLAVGIGLLGFSAGNPFVVAMAVFLVVVSRREARWTEVRERLRGMRVADVMQTGCPALAPGDPVRRCATLNADTGGEVFPVMEAGRFLGIVEARDWRRAVRAGRSGEPVSALLRRTGIAAHPADPLLPWLARLPRGGAGLVPVTEQGRLLGFLAARDLAERLRTPAPGPPPLPAGRPGWRLDVG